MLKRRKRLNKLWYIRVMNYHATIKKKKKYVGLDAPAQNKKSP